MCVLSRDWVRGRPDLPEIVHCNLAIGGSAREDNLKQRHSVVENAGSRDQVLGLLIAIER